MKPSILNSKCLSEMMVSAGSCSEVANCSSVKAETETFVGIVPGIVGVRPSTSAGC